MTFCRHTVLGCAQIALSLLLPPTELVLLKRLSRESTLLQATKMTVAPHQRFTWTLFASELPVAVVHQKMVLFKSVKFSTEKSWDAPMEPRHVFPKTTGYVRFIPSVIPLREMI